MRIVNGLMGLAFIASLLLQLNDPDPWFWAAAYGIAATTCVAWEREWIAPIIHNALIAMSTSVAIWLVIQVPSDVSIESMTSTWTMKNPGVEVAREAAGSTIIAMWVLFLRCFPRGGRFPTK